MRLRFVIPAALVAAGAYIVTRDRPGPGGPSPGHPEPDMTAVNWAEAPAPALEGLDEIAAAAAQASAGLCAFTWPEPVLDPAPEPPPAPAPEPDPEGPAPPAWDIDADWAAFDAMAASTPEPPAAPPPAHAPFETIGESTADPVAATPAPAPDPQDRVAVLSEWVTATVAVVHAPEPASEPEATAIASLADVDLDQPLSEWVSHWVATPPAPARPPAPEPEADTLVLDPGADPVACEWVAEPTPASSAAPPAPSAAPVVTQVRPHEPVPPAPVAQEPSSASDAVDAEHEVWDEWPSTTAAPTPSREVEVEPALEVGSAPPRPEPLGTVIRTGRFSLGGWASAEGEIAIGCIGFDRPLEASPEPDAVELHPDGASNAALASLQVIDAEGFAPDAQGFAISVASSGAGTFLVSGSYLVRTAGADPADGLTQKEAGC